MSDQNPPQDPPRPALQPAVLVPKAEVSAPQRTEVSAFSAHSRLPAFIKTNPRLWFLQVEAVFGTSKVTSQAIKYQAVVANLDVDVLTQVESYLYTPDPDAPYDKLKERLISIYGQSESRRVRKLLEDTQLGSQRPSQLMRKMEQQAGKIITKQGVKELWLTKLPPRMQAILVATEEVDSEKLAEIADRIADVDLPLEALSVNRHSSPHDSAGPSSSGTSLDQLVAEFRQLRAEVAELRGQHNRGRSQSRDNRGYRSRSRSQSQGVCWYHRNFRARAKKCTSPCNFKPKNA